MRQKVLVHCTTTSTSLGLNERETLSAVSDTSEPENLPTGSDNNQDKHNIESEQQITISTTIHELQHCGHFYVVSCEYLYVAVFTRVRPRVGTDVIIKLHNESKVVPSVVVTVRVELIRYLTVLCSGVSGYILCCYCRRIYCITEGIQVNIKNK